MKPCQVNFSLSWIKYALLTGISERVADIKTRAPAMKCLTTFSEAVGPGFIFERVSILLVYIISISVLLKVCMGRVSSVYFSNDEGCLCSFACNLF
jgi:hypothetical protein